MASSKNAREFTLPSFENALLLDSGDFSGLSTTLSASFSECSYGLNTLDDGFLGVYGIYFTLETEIDALALRARDVYTSVTAVN